MLNPLKYNKHFDKLSYDEKMLLEEAKKSIADFVESSPEISDVNFATRNAHAKTHSVLQGVLQINSDLCTSIKYLFDKDEYDIIARLSNANMKISKKPYRKPKILSSAFATKLPKQYRFNHASNSWKKLTGSKWIWKILRGSVSNFHHHHARDPFRWK